MSGFVFTSLKLEFSKNKFFCVSGHSLKSKHLGSNFVEAFLLDNRADVLYSLGGKQRILMIFLNCGFACAVWSCFFEVFGLYLLRLGLKRDHQGVFHFSGGNDRFH